MVVKALLVPDIEQPALHMIKTDQDLLDVLKIAIMFPSHSLEFLSQPVLRLISLLDH